MANAPTKPVLHRDDPSAAPLIGNVKVTQQDWLNLGLDILVSDGVDAIKVQVMADRMGVSRSSFYWYFKSRAALLDALLGRWQAKNTRAMVDQAARPAATITAAVLNVQRCVVDAGLFDTALDFAIRDWARRSDRVQQVLDASDAERVNALRAMFARFGASPPEALTRARVLYYMQLGYDLADLGETAEQRLAMVPHYLRVFTGTEPKAHEIQTFTEFARQHWGDSETPRKKTNEEQTP